ncbi:MAG: YdcF family protein [Cyanobacteria bacterium]|nr:YdcF family protein [Cyanobacteriota bacterium]MDW8202090.1 ElyC/SanA/YdcF family protein [Cyanobacteriota bacterium SKYGB_h_bin112]
MAVAVLLLVGLLPVMAAIYVRRVTAQWRYESPQQVPNERVAIVFGAGVWADGTPTPMLADRIQAAVALYRLGRVQKLLMTGDNSTIYYDEVTTMKRYAMDLGIPEQDITLDYAGFSTYESCYRARDIFGIKAAVLVTQRFHLPRAVYTCRQMGIAAIGLATPDWEVYGRRLIRYYNTREILAVTKALIEVHLLQPLPTFLGPFEGI